VDCLLEGLATSTRGKAKQYDRIIAILWHCYLSPSRHTQLEVAAMLGVSDSLVSDYRRRIEQQLRALTLGGIDGARAFEAALKERVSRLMNCAPPASSNSLQTAARPAADIVMRATATSNL
jgi:hypothetical protein